MPHPKVLMTNYNHKYINYTENISVYQNVCHIDLLASMKSSKSVTFYTQIHQFCDNQSQKLLKKYFYEKVLKKMLDLLKDTQNSPSSWFNVVPSLEKLSQAVLVRNDQVNLQPTMNKGAGGASLTIFVTDCR